MKNSKICVLANLNITKGKTTIGCYTIVFRLEWKWNWHKQMDELNDWLVIRIGTGLIIFYS